MKVKLAAEAPPSSTILGDWFANDIVLNRKQYILCVSEKTRLPVILGAAPYADFSSRLPAAVAEVLRALDIPPTAVEQEIGQMAPVVLAKTNSKSVLGSLNDDLHMLEAYQRYSHKPAGTILEMALRLSEAPSSVFQYLSPQEVTLAAFGLPSRHALLRMQ
jgi:hypothetical protein